MISTMPFHSKSPKESKSINGSSKNLSKRPKSAKNNSDENTLRQKLVQKSILKFLSCSSYSPHQNPIKIELKAILKSSKNQNFSPVIFPQNVLKSVKKKRGEREITSGEVAGRRGRERRRRESWEREGFGGGRTKPTKKKKKKKIRLLVFKIWAERQVVHATK